MHRQLTATKQMYPTSTLLTVTFSLINSHKSTKAAKKCKLQFVVNRCTELYGVALLAAITKQTSEFL